jgi:hypothetical protein
MAQHQDLGVLPPRFPPRQVQRRHGPGYDQEHQLQAHKAKIIARQPGSDLSARHRSRDRAGRVPQSICPGGAGFRHPQGTDAALLAAYLSAERGIGVREGRFCAHPLFARLGITGAVRASLGLGSSSADIDRLVSAVRAFLDTGPAWHYEQAHGSWIPTPDPRRLPGFAT